MKTIFTSSVMLFFSLCLHAQDFSIREGEIPSGDIMVDAWIIELGEDLKFAQKTFKDFAKEKLDMKAKNEGKRSLVAKAVSLPGLSEKRGDMKIHFTPAGDSITAGIAFVLGYDIFINGRDNPGGMAKLKDFTRDFLKYYYQTYYENIIEKNEAELKDLNKELAKSEKKVSKLKKNTRKNDRKLDDEGDAGARAKYYEKNAGNEASINKLSDRIPELRASIEKMKVKIDKARHEKSEVNNKIELYSKIAAE